MLSKKDMVSEWGGLEGDNRDNRDLEKAVSKPKILGLEMGSFAYNRHNRDLKRETSKPKLFDVGEGWGVGFEASNRGHRDLKRAVSTSRKL